MSYLALDTATDRPTLGVGEPRGERRVITLRDRRALSAVIDAAAAELLAGRGLAPRDLAGVVVADGPGSFTGLRIGIAFAKGLARATGRPLLAAPSMLAAAWRAAPAGGLVLVEYDALRGDVYRALYRLGEQIATVCAPALVPRGASLPPEAGEPVARADAGDADAGALLDLVGVPGGAAPVADPPGFEPTYGRLAEAQARRLARERP